MYVKRSIEITINQYLYQGKAIVIYGARQVGKTTLVKKILADQSAYESSFINCDEPDELKTLNEAETSTQLKDIIGNSKLVVIDEAQRVTNIGLKLKLMVDNFPQQQIVATGSSSFELANKISEPMTGRTWEFWLYPFSITELSSFWSDLEINRRLETLLLYGTYPQVVSSSSLDKKKALVYSISNNYLYKDILEFGKIKNFETIRKLLEALALQIGQEVSFTELGKLLDLSKDTIANYISLLEQSFIIFRLRPLSRNLRKELSKLRKIYFYDVGIRNALINNLNPLSLRNDVGVLWENFVVAEMKKRENFIGQLKSYYFWRTWDQQEIDLIEESGGRYWAYEIKWKKVKKQPPKAWRDNYPASVWQAITSENFLNLLKK